MKEFLLRFKNWGVWVSMAALVVFLVKQFVGIDITDTVNQLMDLLLPLLIAFGIVNNPTNSKGI